MRVSLTDVPAVAAAFIHSLPHHSDAATLVTLSGDLGAGKTTFVQALARELGITESVQSPTYVLMRRYDVQKNVSDGSDTFLALIHIDLYRLEKPDELDVLQLARVCAEPNVLVCIEWPERAAGRLPAPDRAVVLSSEGLSGEERYIEGIDH